MKNRHRALYICLISGILLGNITDVYADAKKVYEFAANIQDNFQEDTGKNEKYKVTGEIGFVETSKEDTKENNNQNNGNDSKNQESANKTKGICTMLASVFGIGILTSVLLSVINKLYSLRKAAPLPVLYYGKREETINE
ncbi:MAG: hypothetical protein ACI398_01460 [Clostridium sp.]